MERRRARCQAGLCERQTPQLNSCVALGKSPHLSEPQFSTQSEEAQSCCEDEMTPGKCFEHSARHNMNLQFAQLFLSSEELGSPSLPFSGPQLPPERVLPPHMHSSEQSREPRLAQHPGSQLRSRDLTSPIRTIITTSDRVPLIQGLMDLDM